MWQAWIKKLREGVVREDHLRTVLKITKWRDHLLTQIIKMQYKMKSNTSKEGCLLTTKKDTSFSQTERKRWHMNDCRWNINKITGVGSDMSGSTESVNQELKLVLWDKSLLGFRMAPTNDSWRSHLDKALTIQVRQKSRGCYNSLLPSQAIFGGPEVKVSQIYRNENSLSRHDIFASLQVGCWSCLKGRSRIEENRKIQGFGGRQETRQETRQQKGCWG